MDHNDFEGTLVLEKLAEINKVDAFFDAIDSDDFGKAKSLMKKAGVDAETIAIVMQKMGDADGEH
jgi:iron uptake system EfeUOB component EfeO/EfeM